MFPEAPETLRRIIKRKTIPGYITVKLMTMKDNEKILEVPVVTEKKKNVYKEIIIRLKKKKAAPDVQELI